MVIIETFADGVKVTDRQYTRFFGTTDSKTEMLVVLKHNLYRICERTSGRLFPVCIVPAEQSILIRSSDKVELTEE